MQAVPFNKSIAPQTGILRLGLSTGARDGYLFVPGSYSAQKSSPMILAIHAAGKGGLDAMGVLIQQANSSGALLYIRIYACMHSCPR